MPHVPVSVLADIAWPALVANRPARLLALQYQFRRAERWSVAQLRAHQFAQLRQLLTHAERTMPFWRQRLRAAGIGPDTPLTEESWARIPILSRSEVQEAGTALFCLSVPPAHGEVNRAATSGSTARPLHIRRTALHQTYWDANLLRDLRWHGLDLRGKMAVVRRLAENRAQGTRTPDWGGAVSTVFPTGPAVHLDLRRPIREQAAWLKRENPDYILTFASNLGLLVQHFRDTGEKLPRLRAFRSISETLDEGLREVCRETLGVPILDIYSCEEVGYVALQCPLHEHLHAVADTVFAEVLNDANRPCAPGEVGRLVLTPMHNYAMPLIRYEIGDLVEMGDRCSCGRPFPVFRRILGRTRNTVLLPSGEFKTAYFGGQKLASLPFLRQVQIVQKTRQQLEIRLAVRRPLTTADEARVTALIIGALDYPFESRIVYVDEIPRSPNGKYEDFKREAT